MIRAINTAWCAAGAFRALGKLMLRSGTMRRKGMMNSRQPVELKIYVSPMLNLELRHELELCGCTLTSFARIAIAKELVARRLARNKAARDLPLPGQRSIDGIVER